jgi:hypothetical protein
MQRKFPIILLAAGIAGGIFAAGCSSRDARQETVATVNGDPIKVGELRESLGVPAGVFAAVDIPVERKKEALDRLVVARLLAQEGRALGLDNTPEFKEIIDRNDQPVLIKALLRKEIGDKLTVTEEEIKVLIAKVKKAKPGISDADAAVRAVKSVSWSRVKKIREDLLAAAKKETGAAVEPKAMPRIDQGEDAPDDVVHAGRGMALRALAAYAKKQGIDGSEEYKAMRRETERSVLRDMVADNVAAKNVTVTEKEFESGFARKTEIFTRGGKKIPAAAVPQLKEMIREDLLREKRKAAVDAYIAELRKKATITVNDAILPKV